MIDNYTANAEKLRGDLVKLCTVEPGVMQTQAVCAMMVTVPAQGIGSSKATATAFAPTDPNLGGALLAMGLTAFRSLYPEAFAEAMRRIEALPPLHTALSRTISFEG